MKQLWSCHLLFALCFLTRIEAFSGPNLVTIKTRASTLVSFGTSSSSSIDAQQLQDQQQPIGDILILDHLNINHEKGRHDWLKAFYFDFLKLAVDPRKQENYDSGRKTVWANAGAQQFHLPEGTPNAQLFDGRIALVYPDLKAVQGRASEVQTKLQGSQFAVMEDNDTSKDDSIILSVTDPWGNQFQLEEGSPQVHRDARGSQPGDMSECLSMRDLTVLTPATANLEGIARFYQHIFAAPILSLGNQQCVVSVGPQQTLTFEKSNNQQGSISHTDLRQEEVGDDNEEEYPSFPSNYGPHISMYVADLPACYEKADALGLTYVNPRFKRRAYNLEQAMADCMFRCLNIVDPEQPDKGVILQLEHEVRSVVKRDGSLYKSCPFDKVPP